MFNKNFIILTISQIFSSTPPVVTILLSGIIGSTLIDIKYLATLPTGIMIGGVAISSVIASNLMSKMGRSFGFSLGAIVSTSASFLCAYSIYIESFYLYCFANFFIGFAMAFTHQYRFAVAEIVEKNLIPKAISIVLLLSIVGALLGSTMVNFTKNLVEENLYVGSYICLGFLTILPAILFIFYKDVNFIVNKKQKSETSIMELLSNKKIQQAITSAGIGYVIMSFLMTATPISMHVLNEISLYKTSIVIQLHVVGMFLPSLFTGDLIKKFGHTKIIYTGVIIFVFCIFINFIHQSYYNYMIGLILLGVGWNFTFVTATSLLVISYDEKDKFKVQGLNDFIVFSSQTAGSLFAGYLLYLSNWQNINLFCLPLLLLIVYTSYNSDLKRNNS